MTQKIVEDGPIWNAIDRGGGQTCDIRGVVRALSAEGYVIVPREPTEKMLAATRRSDDPDFIETWALVPENAYRAMIDASIARKGEG